MKYGFTTGSCAAAASKAAAYMLITGKIKNNISITVPAGKVFEATIVDIVRNENSVSCAVIKDGGDDPDVTTGAHIRAEVSFVNKDDNKDSLLSKVIIEGGDGVGIVTKKGLDQPVGNSAINSVPRSMIEKEVLDVINVCDCNSNLKVVISVPEGKELALKTFNPRLGIEGGISILGTTGIVEPMSIKAILETIRIELNQRRQEGADVVAVSPGNYGLTFMKENYSFDIDKSVKCSNFIGDTIDMAIECGFSKMLLTGHIGKLIKVSGGIMNTHSKMGDCRMELLMASALRAGANNSCLKEILECVATEDAINVLIKYGIKDDVLKNVTDRISFYLNKHSMGKIDIEVMVYSNEHGLLGMSDNALELLDFIKISYI